MIYYCPDYDLIVRFEKKNYYDDTASCPHTTEFYYNDDITVSTELELENDGEYSIQEIEMHPISPNAPFKVYSIRDYEYLKDILRDTLVRLELCSLNERTTDVIHYNTNGR